ncbi:DddA-like double-stranded DNA deaminase toxin [Nocardia sp. alder85J]|uniref:DddA-like double-stranded DNA deaminase toxin n=1 Tax=Nocardia sp. alder85J TaxID=2862949 RepID=UPI001CD31604|nr:DddA-like double-stranded DNA deaminase toxin [Nocardia sp. alder85J]MCX4094584.1 hypothetical protein [Nocardia sp. alder85J]
MATADGRPSEDVDQGPASTEQAADGRTDATSSDVNPTTPEIAGPDEPRMLDEADRTRSADTAGVPESAANDLDAERVNPNQPATPDLDDPHSSDVPSSSSDSPSSEPSESQSGVDDGSATESDGPEPEPPEPTIQTGHDSPTDPNTTLQKLESERPAPPENAEPAHKPDNSTGDGRLSHVAPPSSESQDEDAEPRQEQSGENAYHPKVEPGPELNASEEKTSFDEISLSDPADPSESADSEVLLAREPALTGSDTTTDKPSPEGNELHDKIDVQQHMNELKQFRVTRGRIFENSDGNEIYRDDSEGFRIEFEMHSGFKEQDLVKSVNDHLHQADSREWNEGHEYPISCHVETKYAAWMRDNPDRLQHAVVIINKEGGPCHDDFIIGCDDALEAILPTGSTMRVYYPFNGKIENHLFEGDAS